ncbi:hypothetical protein VTO42DRAFT_1492 [Malbranchea cinnamomea]
MNCTAYTCQRALVHWLRRSPRAEKDYLQQDSGHGIIIFQKGGGGGRGGEVAIGLAQATTRPPTRSTGRLCRPLSLGEDPMLWRTAGLSGLLPGCRAARSRALKQRTEDWGEWRAIHGCSPPPDHCNCVGSLLQVELSWDEVLTRKRTWWPLACRACFETQFRNRVEIIIFKSGT